MSGIAIYVEGGGDTADGRAAIRRGFGEFLHAIREAAWRKGIKWKVVPSGGRGDTYDAFLNALGADPGYVPLLLVDSEVLVTAADPAQHLSVHSGWTFPGTSATAAFLMAQVMETWIVADPQALAIFYGQHFRPTNLPRNVNLEAVPKNDVQRALRAATAQTQKGVYHKIAHAEALLKAIDVAQVRSRCPNCDRFVSALEALVR